MRMLVVFIFGAVGPMARYYSHLIGERHEVIIPTFISGEYFHELELCLGGKGN